MSYVKIYVHTVWATKDRYPYLTKELKSKVIDHIRENAGIKYIHIDQINGYTEHLHVLISMNAEQTISNIINLLKGESSFWINKQNLTKSKFGWQDDYFAVSIGESQLEAVGQYIRNQEAHHKTKTFQQEYDEFMRNYKFE
jgi:REP element-mobilizing transposase RayT